MRVVITITKYGITWPKIKLSYFHEISNATSVKKKNTDTKYDKIHLAIDTDTVRVVLVVSESNVIFYSSHDWKKPFLIFLLQLFGQHSFCVLLFLFSSTVFKVW